VDAKAIIEDYVNAVAAKLPRRLRNDIGLELRTLLTEQVRSAAGAAGRAPDSEIALQVLNDFGTPGEVAGRYAAAGFQIIEPEQAPTFVKLASACVVLLWAATLPQVFHGSMTLGDWSQRWGFGALAWVGALLVWYGVANWVRRRSPADPDSLSRPWTHWIFMLPAPGVWRPGEPQATERRAALGAAPLGAILTVFFIAPAWILGHLLPAGTNTSWVLYDESFRRSLLWPLIALMVLRLGLLVAGVLNERWRTPTAAIGLGLRMCFVALLFWTVFRWHIFANAITDGLFKAWLLIFLVINTIQMIVWLRRAATRVRVPRSLTSSQHR
jgi:hypothetical protein